MSSKLSTIFGHSSLGARPRRQRAEGARDRAGHHDVERLDRVDVVSIRNAAWAHTGIPHQIY
jgi:hypothetical protein